MRMAIVQASDMYESKYIQGKVEELEKRGIDTALLSWNRYGKPRTYYGNSLHFSFDIRTPLGMNVYFPLLPFFWAWIFFKLVLLRPNAVVIINTDTVPPCVAYCALFRATSIHEMRDFYHYHFMNSRWPVPLMIDIINKAAIRSSPLIVSSSKDVLDEYCSKIGVECSRSIEHLNLPSSNELAHVKKKRDSHYNIFTVCYIGTLSRNRGILEMVEAIRGLKGVDFLFGGIELEKGYIDECISKADGAGNIRYLGFLSREDLVATVCSSHLIALLLDKENPHHRGPLPTKIFESAYCHTPFITTEETSSAQIAKRFGMGVSIKENEVDLIRESIKSLRDDGKKWDGLVNGCKRAEKFFDKKEQFGEVTEQMLEVIR